MGDVAVLIKEVLPAQVIMDSVVKDAVKILQDRSKLVRSKRCHRGRCRLFICLFTSSHIGVLYSLAYAID